MTGGGGRIRIGDRENSDFRLQAQKKNQKKQKEKKSNRQIGRNRCTLTRPKRATLSLKGEG
jgi:hypothetical protein